MTKPDGIINLHKPTGITSAKALYRVRTITRQRKSGHAGTLDPGASGVLVLCLGRATKLVEAVMDQPKVYRATARLDVTSESFDSDRPLVPVDVAHVPSTDVVRDTFALFEGIIEQVPPAISAVKVDGVPAYKRAARSGVVKLRPRPVSIYWLHVHAYRWPEIDFTVCCGRGTYIRSLIRDLGERLHTGGCLTSLIRERVGPFTRSEAWTLERLRQASRQDEYLISLDLARQLLDPRAVQVPEPPPAVGPATT
jgi:tRNA pseudouridine55 synthase